MDKSILYISYDGMTDPLGQSQVIPYLMGLADEGYNITILSCEKGNKLIKYQKQIIGLLSEKKINWVYSVYKTNPPVLSSLFNYFSLKRKAVQLHKKENFSIAHCRSYISALIGLQMKREFGIKFVFDMRGFWADERVEGGLWNLKNPIYDFIYGYFKRKEKELLLHADHIVSLTEAAKREILNNEKFEIDQESNESNILGPITVIPCCADTKHFDPENLNYHDLAEKFKVQLKVSENDFVISYLGALGTWYLLDEMLHFFQRLLLKRPDAKFLFITHENQNNILLKVKELGIDEKKIIVCSADRKEVPALLLLSRLSIFFIKQSFSKIASSPTKMAELMSMGIPVICNSQVGDVEVIVNQTRCGIAIRSFSDQLYDELIGKLDNMLAIPSNHIRDEALKLFSLGEGVKRYKRIYESFIHQHK